LTVLAVRGPLTRQRLIAAGYSVDAVYGDPGLLTPLLGGASADDIRHEWGIIPHFTEFGHPAIAPFTTLSTSAKLLGKIRRPRVICINPLAPVDEYLRKLRRCRAIASSSLHGLVVAEAHGKPAVWLQLAPDDATATNLMGGAFKFRDFYRGIGKEAPTPLVLTGGLDFEALDTHVRRWQPMQWNPLPLLNSFPEKSARVREVCLRADKYFSSLACMKSPN
jgi:pyruvyltransferase